MLEAIQRNVMWRAIPFAGLIAGTVFLLLNMLLSPMLFQLDSTIIIRYLASISMGESALLTDNSNVLIIGILTHYVLSIIFTLVIAVVVHRWGLGVGIVGGAILGLSIYGINFYSGTLIFDWFFAINNPLMVVSHIVFGAVAGGVYEMLDTYDEPLMGDDKYETV